MLALAGGASCGWRVGGIVAMGFFSASSTMIMTHGRGIFPDRLIGRGMSTMNTCVMLGVACMQTLSGTILGAFAPLADGLAVGAGLSDPVRLHVRGVAGGGGHLQPRLRDVRPERRALRAAAKRASDPDGHLAAIAALEQADQHLQRLVEAVDDIDG